MTPRSILILTCCFGSALAWAETPASPDDKPIVITNADLAKRPKPVPGQPIVITNSDLSKLKPVGVIGSTHPIAPAPPAAVETEPAVPPGTAAEPATDPAQSVDNEPGRLDLAALARANQRLEEREPGTATNAAIAAAAANADTNGDGTVDAKERAYANRRGPFATGQTANLCLCVYGDCKPKGCNPFNQKGRIQVSSLGSKHVPSTAANVAVKPPDTSPATPPKDPTDPPVKIPPKPKKPKAKPPKLDIQKNGPSL